ncbi:MAG: hypothetical protein AAFP03_04640 [Cyanobacteria bacterium J06598_3]
MHQLSPFTCRRLSQLPRLTSVWECDRRPLTAATGPFSKGPSDSADDSQGDCIMWADSLQGVVRGLSVVPSETGHEAIVRTLLQAIESPQGGVEPARPRKVVVCDREIQFFLRGALQDLDIPVEHAPSLPVIDDVFQKLQTPDTPTIKLPAAFEHALREKSALMWHDAPWQYLSEQEILAIELNRWEIETLYLSVLGLAGMEYGLLFYRELDSLKQFRHKLLNSDDFSEGMQQAFLEQNCLFINFNPVEGVIPIPLFRGPKDKAKEIAVDYEFGSLHPLEGLRTQLAEEEAASLVVVLEALHRFFKKHDLSVEDFALKPISNRFRIPNPALTAAEVHPSGTQKKNGTTKKQTTPKAAQKAAEKTTEKAAEKVAEKTAAEKLAAQQTMPNGPANITVKVSTLPEVSALFLEETLGPPLPADVAPLIDDSVPEGALIMLGSHPEDRLTPLREIERIYYQSFLTPPDTRPKDDAKWPILTIQTTRPKARKLVERLKAEGGIESICFNPGNDPMSGQIFQVGLLQTQRGNLHLFNEYEINTPTDSHHLEKWALGSTQNNQCCGCIIATGATGIKKGRPTTKEIVAFFEIQAKLPEEIGLAPLVMSYAVD